MLLPDGVVVGSSQPPVSSNALNALIMRPAPWQSRTLLQFNPNVALSDGLLKRGHCVASPDCPFDSSRAFAGTSNTK